MRKLLLIVYALFAAVNLKAQKDSLLRLFSSAKEDTTKIALLLQVQKLFSNTDFDSSLFYLNKAKSLALQNSTTKYDPVINARFTEYYYNNNDYKKSEDYALKNLKIAQETNDGKLLARTYNNLTAIYNHFGNYKSAIDYALKCVELSEKRKDSTDLGGHYATVSNTYLNLGQYDKCITYAKKAVDIGMKFNDGPAVTAGYNNMAASYSAMFNITDAIYYYDKLLILAQQQQDVVMTTYALINKAYNHFKISDLPGLKNCISQLDNVIAEMPDKSILAEAHNAKALKFILEKDYLPAKMELDSGIALAEKENAMEALGNLYYAYSKFYYTQNKIKEAEQYSYKKDSLVAAANQQSLNFYTQDLEAKYETEKKETRIKLQQTELKQKNTLNYVLIGGSAALLFIFLLTYRNYRNRQKLQQVKIDELETERQLTATEAVLKGEEQERSRLAKDLHDGLGGMLSGIKYSLNNMKENLIMTPDNMQSFERSIDMLDSSIREMRRVAHNMMPEVLIKYGLDTALKEFCNEIDRSGVIDANYVSINLEKTEVPQTTSVTIYRIVQELVNNAIKHATAKTVLVQAHVSPQEKLLAITVEDDGKGFDTAALSQQEGMGWKNIQNRVEFLKGKLDVQSAPGKGTSVMIEISI